MTDAEAQMRALVGVDLVLRGLRAPAAVVP
jgi:hypothetical protein